MGFLKKTCTALTAFFLILWGGAGTQSSNMLLQGGGFIGLLIGLVVLYIFIKMAWRAMGCLPSFLIFTGITCFIIFAIGGFNNGISGVIPSLKAFLGQTESPAQPQNSGAFTLIDANDMDFEDVDNVSENQEDVPENEADTQPQETPAEQNISTFQKLKGAFGVSSQENTSIQNPMDYPAIRGIARVINGDTLNMNGHYIRLYGIDAPEADQTCANKSGRSYACGKTAATWLRDWITDGELECRIMQRDANGNMVGVCFYGPYDLGAAIVNAGWALAYTKYSSVYVPYQKQAMQNRSGLWQGKFYTPADWRKMKAQKVQIKINRPKKRNSMWGF